jgi:glycerol-3-phosphate acyltransferase PlsY
MDNFRVLNAVVIGYFLGSIQTAYLLGKMIKEVDVREMGSHNSGASNAFMELGWQYGVITGLVDILKGTLAVYLIKSMHPSYPSVAYLAGLSAIFGHIFPFYLRFRGGKGVATLVGMLLGYDFRWGLVFLATMVVIPFVADYMAVGSLLVFTLLPILTYMLRLPTFLVLLALILTGVAYIKHWENILRIRTDSEVRMSEALKRR